MPFRAFVAVAVPPLPRVEALLETLRGTGADLKVVDPRHLHLTLSFLGQVPDDAPARAERALRAATRGVAPFTLRLRGVGAFPNARRPRVVWAGLEGAGPLDEVAARARAELEREDLPGDAKPFRAHLTLARAREHGSVSGVPEFLAAHAADELGEFRVDEVRLLESHLSPKGPKYEARVSVPLGAS